MQENFLRTLERVIFMFLAPGLTDHWPCDYERKVCCPLHSIILLLPMHHKSSFGSILSGLHALLLQPHASWGQSRVCMHHQHHSAMAGERHWLRAAAQRGAEREGDWRRRARLQQARQRCAPQAQDRAGLHRHAPLLIGLLRRSSFPSRPCLARCRLADASPAAENLASVLLKV